MNKLSLIFYMLMSFQVIGQEPIDPVLILDRLYEAIGNYNLPKPEIKFTNSTDKVASYNSRLNIITIEQKVIDLCATLPELGENGLAFIIGHELAHSFQSHSKESNFITDFLAFDKLADVTITEERNADIHGAFAGHIAGYDIDKRLHILLDSVYSSYNLDNRSILYYPTKAERKQSSRLAIAKLDTLSTLFEFSQILALGGHHELAREALVFITDYYQGKEVYNNIGVYYILEALNMGDENLDPFIYPIEMDYSTRLSKPFEKNGSKSINPAFSIQREILLSNALRYFVEVKKLDPDNFDGYLNSAIAYLIKKDAKGFEKELNAIYDNVLIDQGQRESAELLESLAKLHSSESEIVNQGLIAIDKLIESNSSVSTLAQLNKTSFLNDCELSTKAVICPCSKDNLPRKFKYGKVRSLKSHGARLDKHIRFYHERNNGITLGMIKKNEEYIQIIKEAIPKSLEMDDCVEIQESCSFSDNSRLFIRDGFYYYLSKNNSN